MMKSIILALAGLAASASAYEGVATFYGAGGNGGAGACMLQPGFNGVGVTVAINGPMWNNAQNCGKCVKITGTGYGIGTTPVFGPIYATIDNVCPECKFGDIDLGLNGDGRWKMNWDFVDCGEARGAGSNLPGKGQPQNNPVRMLRGEAPLPSEEEFKQYTAPEKPILLAPGMYLLPEGAKPIEEVQKMSAAAAAEPAH